MGKSSDQLREEIDAKRDDAGAKIDQLQNQVQDQIDSTRQQVSDTANQVTETVHHVREEAQAVVTDAVDTVTHAVEDFDLTKQVQERPLVSVGIAMLGGFVLGAMLGGDDNGGHRRNERLYDTGPDSRNVGYSSHSSGGAGLGQSLRNAAQKSGLEDTISNAGAALVGSLTEQLRSSIDKSFPGFADKLSDMQDTSGSFQEKAKQAQKDAQR